MPSRRQERINGRIVREVSEIFQTMRDPKIGFVTFTGCTVSADLRNATVRFSVLGDPEDEAESVAAVKKTVGRVQRLIGGRLEMKRTPHLSFVHDKGIGHGAEMSQLIAEARATDPNLPAEDEGEDMQDAKVSTDSVTPTEPSA